MIAGVRRGSAPGVLVLVSVAAGVALLPLGACEPPVVPAPPRCDAPPPTLAPFVVDWPAADLDRVVALARQGTVVVHADGCSLRPLPGCRTMGSYAFQPLPASPDTELVDDDLHQLAPGAYDRLAALGRDGKVRVERSFGGAWVTDHAHPSAAQLQGACDGATHVVRAAYVGAWVLASGNKQLASRGWPQSCAQASPAPADAKAPPSGCDAWLKIELAAIDPMPAAGEACTSATQGCSDATTELACVSGKLASYPCRGPAGCKLDASGVACDDTLATPGDACAGDTFACSTDARDLLSCRDGAFALARHCAGPKHCAPSGKLVECDDTIAQVGDACAAAGGFACTPDHAAMLRCDGRTFAAARTCRGAKGCALDATTFRVTCDSARARAGDPCDQADAIACSEDGGAQLACQGGSYAKKRDCAKGCTVTGDTLRCAP